MVRREELSDLASSGTKTRLDPLSTTEPTRLSAPARGTILAHLPGRKITEMRYTAEEMSLLETLANQTSVALKNALLYEENLAKSVLERTGGGAAHQQQSYHALPRWGVRIAR